MYLILSSRKYGPHIACVDKKDFKIVSKRKWSVFVKRGKVFYAVNKKFGLLHRYIMKPKGLEQVDHIDGNGLNCRRSNLRICTAAENSRNRMPIKNMLKNTSRYKGVAGSYKNNKLVSYHASITYNKKNICLGYYKKEEDAAKAYNKAALKYFGVFSKLNIIK